MNREPFTVENLFGFLRSHPWAVQASVNSAHAPQAAVIGFALTPEREIVFDTERTSRKAQNLRANSRIALVVGWDDAQTAQIEGTVDEPTGAKLERIKAVYFDRFPDGVERAKTENIAFFCVTIDWVRYSDFRTVPPLLVEWRGNPLQPSTSRAAQTR